MVGVKSHRAGEGLQRASCSSEGEGCLRVGQEDVRGMEHYSSRHRAG